MNNILLITKIHLKYQLKRKNEKLYQFLKKGYFSRFLENESLFYVITPIIKFILVSIALGSFLVTIHHLYPDKETLVWFFYCSLFLFFPILRSFSSAQKLLLPINQQMFGLAPLTNRNLFLLNWVIQFLIYDFISYLQFILGGLVLLVVTINSPTSIYILYFAILSLCILLLHFSITGYLCFITYRNVKRGYYWNSFLISSLKSIITFVCAFLIFDAIFIFINSLEISFKNHSIWGVVGEFINLVFSQLSQYLPFLDFFLEVKFAVVLLTGTAVIGCIVYRGIAGVWFRQEWEGNSNQKNDWLTFIKNLFLKLTKDPLLKTQWKHFFQNREQLQIHYSYFYFHYTNFIFLGLVFASKELTTQNEFIWVLVIYVIFNNWTKDAFGSIELFPGLLRFDSERYAINIYQLTGTSFLSLYKRKIKMQRVLGTLESFIMLIIIIPVLGLTWQGLFFGLSLAIFNFVVTPHLNTLSSFVFPHFNYQHFSEVDDFIEDDLIVDKIGYRFRQIIILVFIVPVIFLIFLDMSINIIFLFSAINYLLITCVSLYIIKIILFRKERRYNEWNIS